MNLFAIEYTKDGVTPCAVKSATSQCNKHSVKMPTESGQMLSTAHRLLDGQLEMRPSKSGKRLVKYYAHPDANLENVLYKNVHERHPCTIWTMETDSNYRWHFEHMVALCKEYTRRYEKIHGAEKLLRVLSIPPKNISKGPLTKMPLAMKSNPECMKEDVVESYRLFYQTKQHRFKMDWKTREAPSWFQYA